MANNGCGSKKTKPEAPKTEKKTPQAPPKKEKK